MVETSNERSLWSVRNWLAISLLLHVVGAYFNAGYYHADEHYQVLEFASYKLGRVAPEYLPWEFREKIRPWLQPALTYEGIRGLEWFGVTDPFKQAMAFRLVYAVLAWLAGMALLVVSRSWLSASAWRLAAVLSSCLWFLPFLHTRASSENLSGSLFFFGFCWLMAALNQADRRSRSPHLLALFGIGLVFSLCFAVRFQMGFAIFFLVAWLAVFRIRKWGWAELTAAVSSLLLGVSVALPLTLWLDNWGYGEMTFTPWNYYFANIVQGKAASFGVEPWWEYFLVTAIKPMPFVGIPFLFSLLLCLFFRFNNPIIWVTTGFFAIHSLISHKEPRFLFSVIWALPIILALGFDIISQHFTFLKRWFSRKWIVRPIVVVNMLLLVTMSFLPANGNIGLLDYLYHNPAIPSVTTTSTLGFAGTMVPRFYLRPGFEIRFAPNPDDFLRAAATHEVPDYFAFSGRMIPPPAANQDEWKICHLIFGVPRVQLIEAFIKEINHYKISTMTVYSCGGSTGPRLSVPLAE